MNTREYKVGDNLTLSLCAQNWRTLRANVKIIFFIICITSDVMWCKYYNDACMHMCICMYMYVCLCVCVCVCVYSVGGYDWGIWLYRVVLFLVYILLCCCLFCAGCHQVHWSTTSRCRLALSRCHFRQTAISWWNLLPQELFSNLTFFRSNLYKYLVCIL